MDNIDQPIDDDETLGFEEQQTDPSLEDTEEMEAASMDSGGIDDPPPGHTNPPPPPRKKSIIGKVGLTGSVNVSQEARKGLEILEVEKLQLQVAFKIGPNVVHTEHFNRPLGDRGDLQTALQLLALQFIATAHTSGAQYLEETSKRNREARIHELETELDQLREDAEVEAAEERPIETTGPGTGTF